MTGMETFLATVALAVSRSLEFRGTFLSGVPQHGLARIPAEVTRSWNPILLQPPIRAGGLR